MLQKSVLEKELASHDHFTNRSHHDLQNITTSTPNSLSYHTQTTIYFKLLSTCYFKLHTTCYFILHTTIYSILHTTTNEYTTIERASPSMFSPFFLFEFFFWTFSLEFLVKTSHKSFHAYLRSVNISKKYIYILLVSSVLTLIGCTWGVQWIKSL